MLKSRYIVCIALILTCLAGCMTNTQREGRPIEKSKIEQLVKGKTTMDEVISLFGAPQRNFPMGENTIYIYEYSESKQDMALIPYYSRGTGKTTSDELSITFDKNGVVKTFSEQRGIGKS